MQRENKVSSVHGRISKLKVSAGKRPLIPPTFRDVAQPGSASALGAEGPRFESWYPDKEGFLQQEIQGKTDVRKSVWVRAPQRRKLPMVKLVDTLVRKTETR